MTYTECPTRYRTRHFFNNYNTNEDYYYYYYYYRYPALGPVRAETRAQSGDWYGSGTLHPGHIPRGSLPLLSPNEDIATKFEQEYVSCLRNEEECVCNVCL
jgi:hypothetical protein